MQTETSLWIVTEQPLGSRMSAVACSSEKQAREAFAAALTAHVDGAGSDSGYLDEAGRRPDPTRSVEARDPYGLWTLSLIEAPLLDPDLDLAETASETG